MKLTELNKNYNNALSLTDFLNYAIRCGHDVNNNLAHWINEYNEYIYESSRKRNYS